MTEVDPRYPKKFGPFVLVTPLLESGGVSLCPALRRRGADEQRCLVTHLRLGAHSAPVERRFRRAGEVARRLDHPNVAATLAVGWLEGQLFVAHEFLDGVELSRVPPRQIDAETGAFIACELARAAEYVHEFEDRGLVHQSIAPANIHLGFDGHVKLLECGLSVARDETGPVAPSFHGSARYVAPEVRAGGVGDARSDVFSIGVVLWELLAGRSWVDDPFDRGKSKPTLRADDLIDPHDDRGGGPAGLYAVVARAMSPDPARRYASAAELRDALSPFAQGRFAGPRALRATLELVFDIEDSRQQLEQLYEAARPLLPEPTNPGVVIPRRRRLGPWAASGLAAGALGIVAILAERGADRPAPPLSAPASASVTLERAPKNAPAFAPMPAQPVPPPAVVRPVAGNKADVRKSTGVGAAKVPAGTTAAATVRTQGPARASGSSARPSTTPAPPAPDAADTAAALLRFEPAPPTPADTEARALDALRSAEERFQWGDLDGAESLARTATRALANNPQAFYLLGVVLLAKGEAKDAKAAFERALAIDPKYNDADAKLHLANERITLSTN